MSRIGSIGSPASSGIEKSLGSLSPQFRGHQVALGEKKPASPRVQQATQQTYRQSLDQQSQAMREKQTLLSLADGSPAASGESREQMIRGKVDDAYHDIKDEGNTLTDYKRFRLLKPDIGEAASKKSEAKIAAQHHPPRSSFSSMSRAAQEALKTGAELADICYQGVGVAPHNHKLPEGHKILEGEELPPSLNMFYNDKTGLIHTKGDTKALLAKTDESVIVVFAGTEFASSTKTNRHHSIKADIVQRMGGFSPMYRDAAGIGRMILNHEPLQNKKVVFIGHSLGGGLAQFTLGANVDHHADRVSAMTYNTAGLSASVLGALGESRITRAHNLVSNVRVEGDPVSPGSDRGEKLKGAVLGTVFTLEQPGVGVISPSAHAMGSVIGGIRRALE